MIIHARFKVSSENGVRNAPFPGIPACRSDKEEQTDRHNGGNRGVEKRSPEAGRGKHFEAVSSASPNNNSVDAVHHDRNHQV